MFEIDRVATTREVVVIAPVVSVKDVVGGVVNPAQRERWPHLVAFAGVVVDHVEDDFDASTVQRFHHGLELFDLARGAVTHLGREESQSVVAPVILQTLLGQVTVVQIAVYRQQLNRGYAKLLQVVDHRRRSHPGVSAAQFIGHRRMLHGEAAHVQLVNHHVLPGDVGTPVITPGEGGFQHAAFGHQCRAVPPVKRQVLALAANGVAIECIAPTQAADQVFRVRVEHQLVRVEAVSFVRLVRAVYPVAISHARARLW